MTNYCSGLTKAGKKCKIKVRDEGGFCHHHVFQSTREVSEVSTAANVHDSCLSPDSRPSNRSIFEQLLIMILCCSYDHSNYESKQDRIDMSAKYNKSQHVSHGSKQASIPKSINASVTGKKDMPDGKIRSSVSHNKCSDLHVPEIKECRPISEYRNDTKPQSPSELAAINTRESSQGTFSDNIEGKCFVSRELYFKNTHILRDVLLSTKSPNVESGYLYIYELLLDGAARSKVLLDNRLSGKLSFLKIGRSKDVGRRMKEWTQQCKQHTRLISTYGSTLHKMHSSGKDTEPCPYIATVERLIHLELRALFPSSAENLRLWGTGANICSCGREHLEWFAIPSIYLEFVSTIIKKWIAYCESNNIMWKKVNGTLKKK
ncbi:meiotically up-regulated gene 113-domain-containing protein [Dipodascopsis tothii]|uniref:meiotically up-regulated gene 113-domain-containing protein n=1 Tax=Dipodascopsis tothii TaxID=44089 RepID=UPI0034CFE9E3